MMISRALTELGIVKILFGQNGGIFIKYMGYKIQPQKHPKLQLGLNQPEMKTTPVLP